MSSDEVIEKPLDTLECDIKEYSVSEATFDSFIYKRHGRTDLDPMPSNDPKDPYNWAAWRKNIFLLIVGLHANQGPFSAANMIPAYQALSEDFNVSITKATYLTSVQIVFLGTVPIFWTALSKRIGRRPVYLVSTLVSSVFCLGGSFCHSYGSLMTTRVFQSIFICPAMSIGASTVSEMFFAHEKGQKMGIWVLLFIIGPTSAPFLTGYLIQNHGWQAALYLTAAIQFALFLAHLFFGPETLYIGRMTQAQLDNTDTALDGISVYDRKPFRWTEVLSSFRMAARPLVFLAVVAMSLPFTYIGVFMSIYGPIFFASYFHLSPGPNGLQFLALLIGSILGELFAGRGGDLLVAARTKAKGGVRKPEYRLALAYPGFALAIAGLMTWAFGFQNATIGKWTIIPDIGGAIGIFGLQLLTSVCTTYAIESYHADAADISAFLTVVRQTFSFIAPFYIPIPIAAWGIAKTSGLLAGLTGLGGLMIVICHIWGPVWRGH